MEKWKMVLSCLLHPCRTFSLSHLLCTTDFKLNKICWFKVEWGCPILGKQLIFLKETVLIQFNQITFQFCLVSLAFQFHLVCKQTLHNAQCSWRCDVTCNRVVLSLFEFLSRILLWTENKLKLKNDIKICMYLNNFSYCNFQATCRYLLHSRTV